MFVTHTAFKHPLQPNSNSTLWTSVEVVLHWPWYIATLCTPHGSNLRTFALGRTDDLLLFAEKAPAGRLISLLLVLPAEQDGTVTWRSVPIVRIARYEEAPGVSPCAVVTAFDGAQYGGVPVAKIQMADEDLEPLIEFSTSPDQV